MISCALKENDNIILDCCLYFAQLSGQVRLLSQDRNLALKAAISGESY